MSVKTISKDELRRMEGSEGLIIQGCGGSLDEWVDGINDMLTEDGILLDGTRFHDCSTFEHDGSSDHSFPRAVRNGHDHVQRDRICGRRRFRRHREHLERREISGADRR